MFTRTFTNIVLASLLIVPVLPRPAVPRVNNQPNVNLSLVRAPIRPPAGEASVRATGAVEDAIAAVTPAAITLDGAGGGEILGGYVDALVQDAEVNPIPDQIVVFVATRGTIESPLETDPAGHAYADYLGPCGTDVVTVTEGIVSATIELQPPLHFYVWASPEWLFADGRSTTAVHASLAGFLGMPLAGYTIEFTTTLGSIDSSADTDADGMAEATLVAAATPGIAVVTANYQSCCPETAYEISVPMLELVSKSYAPLISR